MKSCIVGNKVLLCPLVHAELPFELSSLHFMLFLKLHGSKATTNDSFMKHPWTALLCTLEASVDVKQGEQRKSLLRPSPSRTHWINCAWAPTALSVSYSAHWAHHSNPIRLFVSKKAEMILNRAKWCQHEDPTWVTGRKDKRSSWMTARSPQCFASASLCAPLLIFIIDVLINPHGEWWRR